MENPNCSIKKIDGESLLDTFRLSDTTHFSTYLKSVYKDLIRRSDTSNGVSVSVFSNYYDLPAVISNRVFCLFDKDKDSFLSYKEFSEGMQLLFDSPLEDLIKFVFCIFDEDCNGFISSEDVRFVFQYIPLQKKHFSEQNYVDRLESQEELQMIIYRFFNSSNYLDYDNFKALTQKVNSTIFIYLAVFLLSKKPFSHRTLKFFEGVQSDKSKSLSPPKKQPEFIASPNLHSKFSPSIKILNSPVMKKERDEIRKQLKNSINASISVDKKVGYLSLQAPVMPNCCSLPYVSIDPKLYRENTNMNISLLNPYNAHINEFSNYESCVQPEVMLEALSSNVETPREDFSFEGYLIKVVDGKLKKLWFALSEKYLYCKLTY